jgi:hypothetical protein
MARQRRSIGTFGPGVPLERAYGSRSVVTHRDARGVPTSSASAPGAVAAMLDQPKVRTGHRVRGSWRWTGYNAARSRTWSARRASGRLLSGGAGHLARGGRVPRGPGRGPRRLVRVQRRDDGLRDRRRDRGEAGERGLLAARGRRGDQPSSRHPAPLGRRRRRGGPDPALGRARAPSRWAVPLPAPDGQAGHSIHDAADHNIMCVIL